MAKKTVSLVLGSGGARGLIHIGVIRWLVEHDYDIKSISGCSMGALVGGIYAMGKLDIFEKWICEMTKLDTLLLLDVSWKSGGLIQGDKLINKLIELVGDQDIETLPIPYTAIATDLKNGKEVWMDTGPLFEAIRASISLPMFFKPAVRNGLQMIDGGCLNPVPVSPTLRDNNDLTIAVNLDGNIDQRLNAVQTVTEVDVDIESNDFKNNDLDEENDTDPTRLSKLSQLVTSYSSKFSKKKAEKLISSVGVSEVASQAFDAMQNIIARHKLAAHPPDYTVKVARNTCGTLEFERAKEMIELGYQKAEEFLGDIHQ